MVCRRCGLRSGRRLWSGCFGRAAAFRRSLPVRTYVAVWSSLEATMLHTMVSATLRRRRSVDCARGVEIGLGY